MLCSRNAERQGWHPGAAAVGRRRDETPRPMFGTLDERTPTVVIVRKPSIPEKGQGPLRPHFNPPAVMAAPPDEAAVLADLHDALTRRSFDDASRARRALRRRRRNTVLLPICTPLSPCWAGG